MSTRSESKITNWCSEEEIVLSRRRFPTPQDYLDGLPSGINSGLVSRFYFTPGAEASGPLTREIIDQATTARIIAEKMREIYGTSIKGLTARRENNLEPDYIDTKSITAGSGYLIEGRLASNMSSGMKAAVLKKFPQNMEIAVIGPFNTRFLKINKLVKESAEKNGIYAGGDAYKVRGPWQSFFPKFGRGNIVDFAARIEGKLDIKGYIRVLRPSVLGDNKDIFGRDIFNDLGQ